MDSVVMVLAGPIQAWGGGSLFADRRTDFAPSKSGVVGLVSQVLGCSQEDSPASLAAMPLAVRTDVPGRVFRDFQTAAAPVADTSGVAAAGKRLERSGMREDVARHQAALRVPPRDRSVMPLSTREYLADAVFVVALGCEPEDALEISSALVRPARLPFLGRHCCLPSRPIYYATFEDMLPSEALACIPWQASHRQAADARVVRPGDPLRVELPVLADRAALREGEGHGFGHAMDVPVSFSPTHREYAWRKLFSSTVAVVDPHAMGWTAAEDDAPEEERRHFTPRPPYQASPSSVDPMDF